MTTRPRPSTILAGTVRIGACLLVVTLVGYGCGGGGKQFGSVTGAITDVDGRSVPGATVGVGGNTTTSLSNGTYTLTNVQDGFQLVQAFTTISGHRWSGESVVDAVGSEQNRNVNLMVSDESAQGQISGNVSDSQGFPISGAKVFVRGPFTSTLATTNDNGDYTAHKIPSGLTYNVTASFAGFVNQTLSIHVATNQSSSASFNLATSTAQGPIAAPTNVTAQAFTVASSISRSATAGSGANAYEWVKHLFRARRGLPDRPQAKNIQLHSTKPAVRSTPAGSVVEVDLFWDYVSFNDLFGYTIDRGIGQGVLAVTAVARDPLASAFFDVDPALTPDTTYSYDIRRLDTIGFPSSGTEGPPSSTVTATPLAPMVADSPAQGSTTSATPVFHWNAVNRAQGYQIYVWDRFPELLFDPANTNEPSAVVPVWPADPLNPGTSFVNSGAIQSKTYQGPALQSGHTYFWMVVAVDNGSPAAVSALSASQIGKFTVQ